MDANDKLHDSLVSEGHNIGIGGWISGLGLSDLMPDVRGLSHAGWGNMHDDAPAALDNVTDFAGMDPEDGYRSPSDREMEGACSPPPRSAVGEKRKVYGSPEAADRSNRSSFVGHTPPTARKALVPTSEERVRVSARVVARASAAEKAPAQSPEHSGRAPAAPSSSAAASSSSSAARAAPTREPRNVVVKQEAPPRTPARGASPPPRATSDKTDKGLRSFSLKVCQKVQQKNVTTYAEVADELVVEMTQEQGITSKGGSVDDKNIRRRVYDALNVLLAIDVVDKDKKNVRWRGFPSSSAGVGVSDLERNVEEKRRILDEKRRQAATMAGYYVRLNALSSRNRAEGHRGEGSQHAGVRRITMPFVVLKANRDDEVECEKSEDKQEVVLACSSRFDVLEDKAVLDKMELCTEVGARQALRNYAPELADWVVNGV